MTKIALLLVSGVLAAVSADAPLGFDPPQACSSAFCQPFLKAIRSRGNGFESVLGAKRKDGTWAARVSPSIDGHTLDCSVGYDSVIMKNVYTCVFGSHLTLESARKKFSILSDQIAASGVPLDKEVTDEPPVRNGGVRGFDASDYDLMVSRDDDSKAALDAMQKFMEPGGDAIADVPPSNDWSVEFRIELHDPRQPDEAR